MARIDEVKPNVERILLEFFKVEALTSDQDGDLPVRWGSAAYYVRLAGDDHPTLGVWSPILSAVGESPELLAEINAINSQLRFARMWRANDMVMLASELDAEALTLGQVATACNVVGSTADYWGPELQKRYCGKLSFQDEAPGTVGG
jgi:type III secretion system-like peptide-binding chaperone